jgi:hypothetical protein
MEILAASVQQMAVVVVQPETAKPVVVVVQELRVQEKMVVLVSTRISSLSARMSCLAAVALGGQDLAM